MSDSSENQLEAMQERIDELAYKCDYHKQTYLEQTEFTHALAAQNGVFRNLLEEWLASDSVGSTLLAELKTEEALAETSLNIDVLRSRDAELLKKIISLIQDGSFLHEDSPQKRAADDICRMLKREFGDRNDT
jgi:hypothetical protein